MSLIKQVLFVKTRIIQSQKKMLTIGAMPRFYGIFVLYVIDYSMSTVCYMDYINWRKNI